MDNRIFRDHWSTFKGKLSVRLLLVLCLLPLQVLGHDANEFFPYKDKSTHIYTEYYRWQEFLPDGSKIVQEQGPRFGAAYQFENLQRPYPGIIYRAYLDGYAGYVSYDGHATIGSQSYPATSNTSYGGASVGGMLGQRYGEIGKFFLLDLLGGINISSWGRLLRDTTLSNGTRASGYAEAYLAADAVGEIGLRAYKLPLINYLKFGARYPLKTVERTTLGSRFLFPRSRLSFYAQLTFERLPKALGGARLALFYHGRRLGRSPTAGGYYQPESNMDAIGLTLEF
jgi:hypothetical protein